MQIGNHWQGSRESIFRLGGIMPSAKDGPVARRSRSKNSFTHWACTFNRNGQGSGSSSCAISPGLVSGLYWCVSRMQWKEKWSFSSFSGGGDNLKNLKNRKLFSAWAMASWLELKFNNPAGTMFICSEFWGTQRAKDRWPDQIRILESN